MQIEMRKVSELIPYENNPRINDQAVDAVAASIKEFGFKVPVIIDKDDVVIAGHTRIKAARQLDMDEVPTIKADDLTPEQVKAFRIADNSTSSLSDWDLQKLSQEASLLDFDMERFGLSFDLIEPVVKEVKERELIPYIKVHYLITADLDKNDLMLDRLEAIRGVEGVEIESSLN